MSIAAQALKYKPAIVVAYNQAIQSVNQNLKIFSAYINTFNFSPTTRFITQKLTRLDPKVYWITTGLCVTFVTLVVIRKFRQKNAIIRTNALEIRQKDTIIQTNALEISGLQKTIVELEKFNANDLVAPVAKIDSAFDIIRVMPGIDIDALQTRVKEVAARVVDLINEGERLCELPEPPQLLPAPGPVNLPPPPPRRDHRLLLQ